MLCCPTCGQLIPTSDEAAKLFALLAAGGNREVYRGQDGGWYLTRGGGPFSERAVRALVEDGKISSVYSNAPNDAYHIGRTWDYERTMEARRKHGKKAQNYYVGDP